MEVHIDLVLFAQADEQIAGDPHFVGGLLGALAEDLEFPLALGHFGVDAFVVDAGVQTEFEVRIDDLAGDVADVLIAHARVVGALRSGEAAFGEAERATVLVEEIFLLETEPCAGIIDDGRARVGRMGGAIRVHDFVQDDHAILLGRVRIGGNRLQDAIRAVTFGLASRAAIEAPVRELFQGRKLVEILDQGFAADVGNGGVTVQPDIFQFILRHV